MALVELINVNKHFRTHHLLQQDEMTRRRRLYKRNEVTAAQNITFSIEPGEIFGLLGPNGAGKTTTVKMISTLVRPDSGQVLVDGFDTERQRREVLSRVGVVLEGTRTSLWPLTPLENLLYYGALKNVRGRVLKQRAHDLLDFIGLQDKKNVQVRKLSRGQKQKLALCIALIADPKVLLLDEPTTGLDVQSSRAIKDKLLEMTRDQGRAVLVTTHDMHVAQELCDRVGIINRGRLAACMPTPELLEQFSGRVFEFRVDREVPADRFLDIPGVLEAWWEKGAEGSLLAVRLTADDASRSDALYGTVERLRTLGLRLIGLNQRRETLETVFLRITGEPMETSDEEAETPSGTGES
ncbi:MAG TPA: ABC transporter ATP-binding protein [Candidatus Hydrogenedentes bacterium]|nr:ABC transporter ATP-binding protein [Candidatus Hydrogenedentota bacterium]HPU96736.1 ABC transporter ATP-binding protein [Candidatus Hydrogenedentota bacterium]